MTTIIVPKWGRKPTATIRIVAHEGGRLEITTEFEPALPNARSWRQNPAASAAIDMLMAAKMKGVISRPKFSKGGGAGADISQADAETAGHFDRETEEG